MSGDGYTPLVSGTATVVPPPRSYGALETGSGGAAWGGATASGTAAFGTPQPQHYQPPVTTSARDVQMMVLGLEWHCKWDCGSGLWALGFGLCALGFVGCGLWAVGCGLWAVGCGLWAAARGFGLWAVGFGPTPLSKGFSISQAPESHVPVLALADDAAANDDAAATGT
jgi:hypothetical protein